jgi:prevent-host-death family protein
MQDIPISKFKATCLAVLERVRRTGNPVRVTRFGRPIADIVPPSPSIQPGRWLGRYAGVVELDDEATR